MAHGRRLLVLPSQVLFVISLMIPLMSLNAAPGVSVDGTGEWGYHTSSQISAMISDLARDHPGQATATTAQALLGVGPIEGGRTIPILFIGDPADGDPNVLLLGAHHGDEPDSAEAVLAFATYILEEENAVNSAVLDSVNIIAVPVVNPYGLDHGTRTDEDGQDPNRDYPFAPTPVSSFSDGIPLTTEGALAVNGIAAKYPIEVGLSFHTGSWGIYTTWGAQGLGNVTPDHRPLMDLGRAMSKASAQDMPFGPANDFEGVSYITGAFDDHLYGSTVLPGMEYSQNMVLPYSTASYTVELRQGYGKDPSLLGAPSDMGFPTPSMKTVPTAIRICLAACLFCSPSAEALLDGAEAEFTVYGADTVAGLSLEEVRSDGEKVRLEPTIGYDDTFPIVTLRTSYTSDATSLFIRGDPHVGWNALQPGAYPAVAPRSLLAATSYEGLCEIVPLRGSQTAQPVIISQAPVEVLAGSAFNVTLVIDPPSGTYGLTLRVESEGYRKDISVNGPDLVAGRKDLTLKAPGMEGYAVVTATIRTERGDHNDSVVVRVSPDLVWTTRMEGPTLNVFALPVGASSIEPIIVSVRPVPPATSVPELYAFYIGPGQNVLSVDLSALSGTYTVEVYFPPYMNGITESIEVPPSVIVSELPIHIADGRITFGPVTAYVGRDPMGGSGPFGPNDFTVIMTSGTRTEHIAMDFVDLDALTEGQRELARDQARMAGSDPSALEGAYIKTMDLPGPGDYTIGGFLVNDLGEFQAPEGHATDRVTYGSFTVQDGHRSFPYLLVAAFLGLLCVMLVVSYLRFPAKMESLARKEIEDRRKDR